MIYVACTQLKHRGMQVLLCTPCIIYLKLMLLIQPFHQRLRNYLYNRIALISQTIVAQTGAHIYVEARVLVAIFKTSSSMSPTGVFPLGYQE